MSQTLDIIHREHEALAALLQTMRQLATDYADHGVTPDFTLFATMIDYIARMPEALHHPKEEGLLLPMLRRRAPEGAAMYARVAAEHHESLRAIERLSQALVHFMAAGPSVGRDFRRAVDAYADQTWEHIAFEEREIMPLARRIIPAEDWAAIDAKFAANADPYRGPQGEYDALFKRIVQTAPAPYGVGRPE